MFLASFSIIKLNRINVNNAFGGTLRIWISQARRTRKQGNHIKSMVIKVMVIHEI
jgi:hypothetical protein